MLIQEVSGGIVWRFTGFYGFPFANNKSDSWDALRRLGAKNDLSWFVCGDFNEIYTHVRKKGFIEK